METGINSVHNQQEKISPQGKGSLEITTLGGLAIFLDGRPLVKLHSRKSQALLVYLAATSRPQPREVLADLLWEDFSQAQAMNNLRVVLSNLRKHLGDHLLITRETAGMNPDWKYGLDVAVLDAYFDLVSEIESKPGTFNREDIKRIEDAIGLYKGEFLSGFFVDRAPEFDAWMVVERERFHHIVLDGLSKLVRWELVRGEYTAGTQHAFRWIQLDPLSEASYRQLMRLLALGGERSAALTQFEKCRDVLAEELGVEPDPRTFALYEEIRTGTLTSDETISYRVAPTETVQPEAYPHNLPVQTTPFIGREQDLANLNQLLLEPEVRLVTVVGAGGMGKTRLAVEVGSSLLDQFSDGVFFVPLSGLRSVDRIIPTILQALRIEFPREGRKGGDSQMVLKESLLRNIRRKQMLLILDNFEHLLEGADLVREIIQAASRVKILATSRAGLNMSGEHRFQIMGMDYPEDIKDEEAQKYGAVRLFLESARRARSNFKLSSDGIQPIVQICRIVEGMPLGIQLAAAWVETLSPDEIAVEIARNLDLLETDLGDIPERHRSIRALFEHSWSLLSAKEQEVFEKFSLFRGGGTREAVQQITGATLSDLRNLVSKSLLHRSWNGRYEIHELSREYAAEKLQGNLEARENAFAKYSAYYNSVVQQWGDDLKSARQETALTEMDRDIENIRTAWNWAVEARRVDLVSLSIEGLRHYFDLRIRWQEAERTFRQAAEGFQSASTGEELQVYTHLLSLQGYFTHSIERKRELYQRSLKVANQLEAMGQDIRHEKALALYFIGELASRSEFEESIGYYNQSLRLFEEIDDRYWIADTLTFLGGAYYLWGKLDEALKFQQQSLAKFRALGDPRKIAHPLGQIQYIYSRKGMFEEAERAARERLEIYDRIGDPSSIAFGQGELGGSFRLLGEFEKAEKLLKNAMEVNKELEHFNAFFLTAMEICLTELDLGVYDQAYHLAQSALAWSGDRILPLLGWPIGRDTEARRMGIALTIQGMAALAQGNAVEAAHLLQKSFKALQDIQPITLTAFHHPVLGIVCLNMNETDQAKKHIRDGLKIGIQISSALSQLYTLGAAALYLASSGDLERAIEIRSLVMRYPVMAKSRWFQDIIESPLKTMTVSLPPEVAASAMQRGRERDLGETVQALFAEFSA